jgi:hypothetical protein
MTDALAIAFATAIEAGTVDIVQESPTGDIEVQADQWTIVLPVDPAQPAFVALDEITESDTEHRTALDSAFLHADLEALRAANTALGGALVELLAASPDRLAVLLAERLS